MADFLRFTAKKQVPDGIFPPFVLLIFQDMRSLDTKPSADIIINPINNNYHPISFWR